MESAPAFSISAALRFHPTTALSRQVAAVGQQFHHAGVLDLPKSWSYQRHRLIQQGLKFGGAQRLLAEIRDRALLLQARTEMGLGLQQRRFVALTLADVAMNDAAPTSLPVPSWMPKWLADMSMAVPSVPYRLAS